MGPEIEVRNLVRLSIPEAKTEEKGIAGEIIALDDPFGSLISNIEGKDFLSLGYARGDKVRVTLGERQMVLLFAKTFSDVPVGEPLVYIDSRGYLGLAVNQRDFARTYSVTPPLPLFVARKRAQQRPARHHRHRGRTDHAAQHPARAADPERHRISR